MAEYIDRQAAINVVKKWFDFIELNGDICIDGLISLPNADVVERKPGKWETDEVGCAICSVCRNYAFETTTHHISGWYPRFCPHCGAKMEDKFDDNPPMEYFESGGK